MKKKTISVLSVLYLVGSLALGCGDDDEDTTTTDSTSTAHDAGAGDSNESKTDSTSTALDAGAGDSNESKSVCEQAYEQVKACMDKIEDCAATCTTAVANCTAFQGYSSYSDFNPTGKCEEPDKSEASNILAATQTPENCCQEGSGD